jgi:hypothetical protein
MLHQKFRLMPKRQEDIYICEIDAPNKERRYIPAEKMIKLKLNHGDFIHFIAFNNTKKVHVDLDKKYPRIKIRIDLLDEELNIVQRGFELVKEGAFIFKKDKINLKKFHLGVVLIDNETITDRLVMIVV